MHQVWRASPPGNAAAAPTPLALVMVTAGITTGQVRVSDSPRTPGVRGARAGVASGAGISSRPCTQCVRPRV